MISVWLLYRYEFIPIPSCGSLFVYIGYRFKISCRYNSYQNEFIPASVPGQDFRSRTKTRTITDHHGRVSHFGMKRTPGVDWNG